MDIWGGKKIKIVNLILLSSLSALIFYFLLSVFLTPLALNKSRSLLSQDKFNSFLPTIRSQQFSDSFKGFTFIVDKKINEEVDNIFLHDTGNNLKNLSSNIEDVSSTTIIAEKGIIKKKFVFSEWSNNFIKKRNNVEVLNFDQLNINLTDLSTSTIKIPKLQETSTFNLIKCFLKNIEDKNICNEDSKKEILPILLRRLVLPFYIPAISLICSFLLVKNNSIILNKFSIYVLSFFLLVFTELFIRYTGINYQIRIVYILLPFLIMVISYLTLIYKFKKRVKIHE